MSAYRRRVPRICFACLAPRPNPDGPDPCLGTLPGVRFACCGHGHERHAYVVEEGQPGQDCPRGAAALARLRELGGNPPEPLIRNGPVVSTDQLWPAVLP